MTREVVEHLDLARLRLAHYRGQLGEAIYRLQGPILVPDLLAQGGGGIGADEGWRLYLDPVEVLRWTIAQVATALEHEVWHGILDHAGRARVRGIGPVEAGLWNICADFEINTMMGRGASWPYPVLFPEDYGLLPGLTAEQYFNEIKRQRVQPPSFGFQFAPACGDGQGGSDDASGGGGEQGDGAQGKAGGGEQGDGEQGKAGSGGGKPGDGEQGKAGGGGGKPGDAQGKAGGGGGQGRGSISDGLRRPWEEGRRDVRRVGRVEGQLARTEVARRVLAQRGRGPGSLPASLVCWAEALLAPPVLPWRHLLGGAVRSALAIRAGQTDYTRRGFGRRQLTSRVLLPRLRSPEVQVAVVADTSGSMHDAGGSVLSEVQGIIKAAGGSITLYAVDTKVHEGAQRIGHTSRARLVGGGGTDLSRGMAAAVERRPDVLVVLTDGWNDRWGPAPPCLVVVALVGRDHAPKSDVPAWAKCVEVLL